MTNRQLGIDLTSHRCISWLQIGQCKQLTTNDDLNYSRASHSDLALTLFAYW